MIEKNAKFTATMTFNSDKELVQTLRDELKLGEKECMHFLIKVEGAVAEGCSGSNLDFCQQGLREMISSPFPSVSLKH